MSHPNRRREAYAQAIADHPPPPRGQRRRRAQLDQGAQTAPPASGGILARERARWAAMSDDERAAERARMARSIGIFKEAA